MSTAFRNWTGLGAEVDKAKGGIETAVPGVESGCASRWKTALKKSGFSRFRIERNLAEPWRLHKQVFWGGHNGFGISHV